MNDKSLNNDIFNFALKDDHNAFKKIFFEFYPALCVFAGRYISSSEACEDIVQEVFFNIWKNRKNLQIHTSFRNFLITSVRNKCNDYLRKESSHSKYVEKINTIDFSDSPDDIYTVKELQNILQSTLNKLSPNVRTAFEMSRVQRKTYKEIAIEMNISHKTVESYISQALKILRNELHDYLPIALFFTSFI